MAYARYTVSTERSPAEPVTSERRATAPEAGLWTDACQTEPECLTVAAFQGQIRGEGRAAYPRPPCCPPASGSHPVV